MLPSSVCTFGVCPQLCLHLDFSCFDWTCACLDSWSRRTIHLSAHLITHTNVRTHTRTHTCDLKHQWIWIPHQINYMWSKSKQGCMLRLLNMLAVLHFNHKSSKLYTVKLCKYSAQVSKHSDHEILQYKYICTRFSVPTSCNTIESTLDSKYLW
jgi:hypothetical protein